MTIQAASTMKGILQTLALDLDLALAHELQIMVVVVIHLRYELGSHTRLAVQLEAFDASDC